MKIVKLRKTRDSQVFDDCHVRAGEALDKLLCFVSQTDNILQQQLTVAPELALGIYNPCDGINHPCAVARAVSSASLSPRIRKIMNFHGFD